MLDGLELGVALLLPGHRCLCGDREFQNKPEIAVLKRCTTKKHRNLFPTSFLTTPHRPGNDSLVVDSCPDRPNSGTRPCGNGL